MSEPVHQILPPTARWTHIALRVKDIDASIAWYGEFTPLELLDRRSDAFGHGAWLGQPDSPDKPFILVLAQFFPETDPFKGAPQEILAPFAHLGIELTSHDEVDEKAAWGEAAGCLGMAADGDAAAHRLHLHAARPRRQQRRVLLRPGRVREGQGGLGRVTPREVAEGYLGAFARGDPDEIASWVTEDFVNEHTAAIGRGCVGRAEYRQRLPGFLSAFAGVTYEVEDLVVDGTRVAAAYTLRARWEDAEPVEVRGIQRLTIRDDLIARRVDYWDSLAFILQVDPTVRAALSAWI